MLYTHAWVYVFFVNVFSHFVSSLLRIHRKLDMDSFNKISVSN